MGFGAGYILTESIFSNFTPFGAVTFSIGIFHCPVYLQPGFPFDVQLTELRIFAFLPAETAFSGHNYLCGDNACCISKK